MQEKSKQIGGSALRHAAITVAGGYIGVSAAQHGIDLPPEATAEAAERIVTVGLALGGGIGAALGAGVRWILQRIG